MKGTVLPFLVLFIMTANGQPGFNVYFGNLHSHTNNSDGQGTPFEAYTFARDSAHIDFLGVTDHLEYLSFMSYMSALTTADAMTQDSVFVGIYGYEWTSSYYGHCDVFATEQMISASSSSLSPGGWDLLTSFVRANPPAFAQFNHPGRYSWFNNWDDFNYVNSSVDSVFPLIEFQNITEAQNFYERSLNKGWHVSPVWNQDNHYGDWGLKNNGRAGIWATDLSRSSLYNAIRNRRTFATMDKNASVWIESGNVNMGSVTNWSQSTPVHLVLNDNDNEMWYRIELVTSKGVLDSIFPTGAGNIDTTLMITDTVNWVFIRASQLDADMIWSAPVFFESTTSISLSADNPSKCYSHFNGTEIEIKIFTKITFPVNVEISDASGKLILGKVIHDNSGIIKLNASGLAKGIYNIVVYNSEMFFSDKVIITGN